MNVQRGDPSHFDHVKNFIECMKTRQPPISDIEIAHRSTTAPQLANIALRSGHQIRWDGQREQMLMPKPANGSAKNTARRGNWPKSVCENLELR